jgi:hypothetical protein
MIFPRSFIVMLYPRRKAVNERLNEQDAKVQKAGAQLEVRKCSLQMVLNNQ